MSQWSGGWEDSYYYEFNRKSDEMLEQLWTVASQMCRGIIMEKGNGWNHQSDCKLELDL